MVERPPWGSTQGQLVIRWGGHYPEEFDFRRVERLRFHRSFVFDETVLRIIRRIF